MTSSLDNDAITWKWRHHLKMTSSLDNDVVTWRWRHEDHTCNGCCTSPATADTRWSPSPVSPLDSPVPTCDALYARRWMAHNFVWLGDNRWVIPHKRIVGKKWPCNRIYQIPVYLFWHNHNSQDNCPFRARSIRMLKVKAFLCLPFIEIFEYHN